MPESQAQLNQMILDELRGQRSDIKSLSGDVGELKSDVRHLKEGQEDITERLKSLEVLAKAQEVSASKQINLDWKTVLKIVATLAVVALGASHGLPEGAWKALIGILGAG